MKNKKSIAIAMSAVSTLGAVAPIFACETGDIQATGQLFAGEHLVNLHTINNKKFVAMTEEQYEGVEDKNENPVVAIIEGATKFFVVRQEAGFTESASDAELAKLNRFKTEIKSDLEKTYKFKGEEKPVYKIEEKAVERDVQIDVQGGGVKTITVVDYIVTLTSNIPEDTTIENKTFRFAGLRLANTGLGFDQEIPVQDHIFNFTVNGNGVDGIPNDTIYVDNYRNLNQTIFELNEAKSNGKIIIVKNEENDTVELNVSLMDGTSIANITINNISNIAKDKIKVIPGTNDFNNHWAKDTIVDNMLDGVIDVADAFRPEDSITRAEFAKIMVKRFGETEIPYQNHMTENFKDVKANDWYYEYVTALANKKVTIDGKQVSVLEGNGDGTFRPDAPITRQEAAKMIATLLGKGETYMTDSKGNRIHNTVDTTHIFADGEEIAEWADESVKNLNGLKVGDTSIITGYKENGKTYFKPANNIKRAEALVMMDRAFEAR